jgi:ABC-type dipeptide/oligopeptide/nickel transport system permease subunit
MNEPVKQSTRDRVGMPSEERKDSEAAPGASSATMAEAYAGRKAGDTRVNSPFRDALRRFRTNWAAVFSLGLIILLTIAAIFAPLLHTVNPDTIDYNALSEGPSWTHWFGTDPSGRDEYSQLMYGLRITFVISYAGTFVTVFVGMSLGVVAGYYGKIVDALVSRFTDFMFAFPAFLLAIILVSLFGGAFDAFLPNGVGRAFILILVFGLVSWPPLMRFVRSLVLGMKESQFIEAARTSGTSNRRIMTRHLVPNLWGLVLVQAAFVAAFIIGTEAVLSIIGLGVNEPVPDLGRLLYDTASYMDQSAWGIFFPSLFLTLIILSFTFIGDGIRDAVDPRST